VRNANKLGGSWEKGLKTGKISCSVPSVFTLKGEMRVFARRGERRDF